MKKRIPMLTIAAVVLFSGLIAWLVSALINIQNATDNRRAEAVRTGIENGITLCYAIEGEYPVNLEHLKENYGVVYDTDEYLVHYAYFAANIRPNVVVIERA